MGEASKGKIGRSINVRARAQLFERPTTSAESAAAEAKRRHGEAALKARTVQQVLKQVEKEPLFDASRRSSEEEVKPKRGLSAKEAKVVQQVLKQIAPASGCNSESDEIKPKRGESAREAKKVKSVLKQVASVLSGEEEDGKSVKRRESSSGSEHDREKSSEKSIAGNEGKSPDHEGAAKLEKKSSKSTKELKDVKLLDDKSSECSEKSKISEEPGAESNNEIKKGINKNRKLNSSEESGKVENSDTKSSNQPEDVTESIEKLKKSVDNRKKLENKNSTESSKELRKVKKTEEQSTESNTEVKTTKTPTTKLKKDDDKANTDLETPKKSDENEKSVSKDAAKSCGETDKPSTEDKKVNEKTEKAQKTKKPEKPTPTTDNPSEKLENSLTTNQLETDNNNKPTTTPSSDNEGTKTTLQHTPDHTTHPPQPPGIEQLLLEECNTSLHTNDVNLLTISDNNKNDIPATKKRSNFWRVLSDSGSSTSSSLSEKEIETNPTQRPTSSLLNKLGLNSRSSTTSPELKDEKDEEKKGRSNFARPSSQGGDGDFLAAARANFSNATSSGADKWSLESHQGDLLRLNDENPTLSDLLNSVQKIQEEFGRIVLDEAEVKQTTKCVTFRENGRPHAPPERVLHHQPISDEMERRGKAFGYGSPTTTTTKSCLRYEPLSPTGGGVKVHVTPKPELPSYLTVGRRGLLKKKESGNNNSYSDSEKAEFDKIDSILNELDFSKYKRGRANTLSAPRSPRSLSESPRPGTRIPLQPVVNKCVAQQPATTRLNVPPHTYRQYSLPVDKFPATTPTTPRGGRHKLKELTEKLKPNDFSAPPPPASPRSDTQQQLLLQQQWHNQQLQQQLMQQHKQLQQLQQQHLQQLQRLQQQSLFDASQPEKAPQYFVSGSLTIPPRGGMESVNPKIEIVSEDSQECTPPPAEVCDEGLGAESSGPASYAQVYRNVTSSPANFGRRLNDNSPDPCSPDKKGKRRKSGNNSGLSFEAKNGNGRSLTYPPQRKGSVSEELVDYTSVDSNGMRSFGKLETPNDEPRRQLSDVSLADSHFSPSESKETFLEVMERVIQGPNEVDERAGAKSLKKKHYSDPSGDKNNEGLLDLPELIASAKSDSMLGKKSDRTFRVEQEEPEEKVVSGGKVSLRMSQSAPTALVSSDAEGSDKERFSVKSPHQQRRYFKKKLRGPYGEMLEEEMRKSGEKQMHSQLSMANELSFLQEIIDTKSSGGHKSQSDSLGDDSWQETQEQLSDSNGKSGKGDIQDTRTHVVGELYDTEQSYVESLQILVNKYYQPLKSSENSGLVDGTLVDDMFYQIPEILTHHESFLDLLRHRLENWDSKQKVGDVFVEAFTKQQVINTYTAFINNWKTAKEAIKIAVHAKPAFAKFLEHMSREHKGKLALDALLIMPVQRIPRYELLIKELLKHTQGDHPDHRLLVIAQKEVHELAVKINRMEKEAYAIEQMIQKLKEIENVIDGLVDLVQPDRAFLRYDLVTMSGGLGTKKERCLFLFSDLLIITSIKRKSGTAIRKASAVLNSPTLMNSPLDMNKYKLLMKLSLEDLDMSKNNDVNVKKTLKEIDQLEEDSTLLGQISDLSLNLNCFHQNLDEIVRDMMQSVTKQLQDKHSTDAHMLSLELTVTTQDGIENLTLVFSTPEKRASWETAFTDAKQKLSLTNGHRPPPEFISPVPIRKTRAGLQFTCATPTLGLNCHNLRDIWVCNSDGYVGQVCVLSLQPDPTVTSCNGVTNARILCIASVPAASATEPHNRISCNESEMNCDALSEGVSEGKNNSNNIQLDSESSEEDDEGIETQDDVLSKKNDETIHLEESHDVDDQQPTMWLGTEDGCIHIYNCYDNIRTKKNKVKLQHSAPIHCILHTDNKVFVSLANGDLTVYKRDAHGGWRTNDPKTITVGNAIAPISRMINVAGKLWCACQNTIKVFNTSNLEVEHTFAVTSDTNRSINCIATSGFGVWLSIQNSATIKLFHATSFECLLDLSVAASVTKMLAGCDDIIRQHKSACLRITALLACKDLMWVGTSAGVILTIVLPHLTSTSTKLNAMPTLAGISHGHSGHVRFLTYVEMQPNSDNLSRSRYSHRSLKGRDGVSFSRRSSLSATMANKMLVISGGDGYEDFRNTDLGETAGRDDSTNHLLLWQV